MSYHVFYCLLAVLTVLTPLSVSAQNLPDKSAESGKIIKTDRETNRKEQFELLKRRVEAYRIDPKKNELSDQEKALIGTLQLPEEFEKIVSVRCWQEFTAETVVLATLQKTTFKDDEALKFDVFLDHRGDYPIDEAIIYLNITDSEESTVKHDRILLEKRIEPNWAGKIASYELELSTADYLEAPTRLDIEILLRWSGYRNPNAPNSNHYSVQIQKSK